MTDDDVIREVRAAREAYARSHGFSIRAMVADLQARDAAGDWPVVSRPARRPPSEDWPNPEPPPTEAATPTDPAGNSPDVAPAAER